MAKIKLKKTSTPGKMPNQSNSAIEVGELLMNIASASTADNFLTTLKANGKSGTTSDYIKWSDDEANEKKFTTKTDFDALVEDIEDNELVIATALNQLNESAGFSEGGLSVLPNQQSLTEAIQDLQADKSDIGHNHDDRYYTETEMNTKLAAKSDTGHTHSNYLSMKSCNNTDFNTLKTAGWYYGYIGMTNAAYPNNISVTEVIVYSSDWLVQRQTKIGYINNTTTDTWERHFYNGNAWSGWAKVSNTQADWWATGSTMASYIKNKPTITGSTILGITGNTLGVFNLANSAVGTLTLGGGSTTQTQADWLTTATTDASYIKNKPTITGSTILGVTGNTVMVQNVSSRYPTTVNIGDDTVLNTKSLSSNAALTRSIASGMCLDTLVPDTYLKLANGTKWGSGYNNAILTISRYNTDKYSSQLGFSQGGIYYRGFGDSLPTTSASWAKVLLSDDNISATTALVLSNEAPQNKLYLVGATTAGSSDYKQLYNDSRIYTSGGCLFATSDERLKDFYEDVDCDLDALKSIPKKYFSWKSDDGKGRQVGTSAQELRKLYPEIVSVDEDGTHSVAYDRLSIVALSAIDKLYDTIKELQTKNEELEKRIKDLENK